MEDQAASGGAMELVLASANLDTESVTSLRGAFDPIFSRADEWLAKAKEIRVTDATQKVEMKLARESRLALKNIRVEAEHARKRLKEDYVRRGKAIDGIANVIKSVIEPVEEYLEEQERFAERVEAARRRELQAAREAELSEYVTNARSLPLGDMTAEAYAELLGNSRLAHEARRDAEEKAREEKRLAEEAAAKRREEARIEAAKKAEEQRQLLAQRDAELAAAREEARRAEKEREEQLAKERAEAAKREAALKAEREAMEAKAKKERAEREAAEAALKAAEAALKAAHEAEEKRRAAEEDARKPTRAKYAVLVEALRTIASGDGLHAETARAALVAVGLDVDSARAA